MRIEGSLHSEGRLGEAPGLREHDQGRRQLVRHIRRVIHLSPACAKTTRAGVFFYLFTSTTTINTDDYYLLILLLLLNDKSVAIVPLARREARERQRRRLPTGLGFVVGASARGRLIFKRFAGRRCCGRRGSGSSSRAVVAAAAAYLTYYESARRPSSLSERMLCILYTHTHARDDNKRARDRVRIMYTCTER